MAQEFLHPSARQNAMKWGVGMIILLLVRICCLIVRVIATMSYSMYQLTHTQARPQVLSLQAYLSAPQSLGANVNKVSFSMFLLRLSSFSLTFPDACGHFRDVWEQRSRSRFRVGLQERAHVVQ